ncbi:MAG: cytochrome c, partial [Hyphomicrobiales bacterium]|nr:cytochrome c [Hyphomicrobiales bacterium]
LIFALILTVWPWSLPAESAESAIARGRAFAQLHCAQCHAISRTGASRNSKAPPFRSISRDYPYRILLEGLRKGVVISHEPRSMPAFVLTGQAARDIVTYMQSLRAR